MPRFVILKHDCPRGLHWDLMLEVEGGLATWAMSGPPGEVEAMAAEALPDHRLAYLDYEGPVSGGRGTVARYDQGVFEFEHRDEGEVAVVLQGAAIAGRARLVRQGRGAHWWFSWIERTHA